MGSEIWSDRTLGSSGLSIGTHLALETLFSEQMMIFDEKREFTKVDPNKYDYHIFNIYTLSRNILNATPYKYKDELIRHKKFVQILAYEAELIKELYKPTKCKALLFYPDYDPVYKAFNIGKEDWEFNPRVEHLMIRSSIDKIDKKVEIKSCNDGKGFKIPSSYKNNKLLITTNIVSDLFFQGHIDLLESHTGKVKSKSQLNSKYHKVGKADLSHLPFSQELLYILGDKNIVRPLNLMIRKSLLDTSVKFNWNVRTTSEKIRFNLRMVPELKDIISQFKSIY